MLPLSQGHLTCFSTCPRKFKYIFFDALSSPSSYEQKAKTQWGSQFHMLMQQRALDLPIEVMSAADDEMTHRLQALAKAAPQVFEQLSAIAHPASSAPSSHTTTSHTTTSHTNSTHSEQRRTLAFNDYLLTVIYDLVIESPDSAQIFDWKTHQQPPRKEWLETDWQTRLYLYVLCETTDLAPEQISMTYCFVRIGSNNQISPEAQEATSATTKEVPSPDFYRFGYSESQHRKTQQDLLQLTGRLTQGIAQIDANPVDIAFPKIDEEKGLCEACLFNIRCDRASSVTSFTPDTNEPYKLLRAARQITAETVPEIPI